VSWFVGVWMAESLRGWREQRKEAPLGLQMEMETGSRGESVAHEREQPGHQERACVGAESAGVK
jgi:hypothetical protein